MSPPPNPNSPSGPVVSRPLLKKDLLKQREQMAGAEVPRAAPAAAPPQGVPAQPGQVYRPTIKKREQPEVALRTDNPVAELAPEDSTEKIVKGAPPWMASAIIHIVAMIVLALIIFTAQFQRSPALDIVSEIPEEDEIEDVEIGVQLEKETDSDLEVPESADTTYEDMPVEDPLTAPIVPEFEFSEVATEKMVHVEHAFPAMRYLDGRNPGGRKGLIGRYGGTKKTEDSVELALKWLKAQQLKNGSWSLIAPYSNGAETENQESATAMALLAFQGAGNTRNNGEYKTTVARGWNWLLKQQDPKTGSFFTDGVYSHRYYTHGQCTIAICELYAMEKDKKLLEPAKKAVQYLLNTQSPEGSWRYYPGSDSDMSVTGWCVMALQSARMADMKVPQEALDRISAYMDKIAQRNGARYPYQRHENPTEVMTAEAMLCRQYLGWKQNDPRMEDALDYVLKRPISYTRQQRDVYYWYYATQAMHHKEGRWWKQWNEVMREVVPAQQVKDGKEKGSWDPVRPCLDTWQADGGRLYVTCLSTYMLEVYYRHLPIYAKMFDEDGLPVPYDGTVELSVDGTAIIMEDADPMVESAQEAAETTEEKPETPE